MFASCAINVEPIEALGRRVWSVEATAAAAAGGGLYCLAAAATPLVAGLSVAAAAMGSRYMVQAWQAFRTRAAMPRVRQFYPGGFEREMTTREAALILGVRERAAMDKIKEAHKRVMVANHPDAGGSHYMASKINEAKELLMGKGKSGSMF
ncbi:hypothetical protein ABZP36_006430 [Zizania latifolia]